MGTCQCKPEKDVIGVNDVMMRSSIETPGWRDEDSDDEVVLHTHEEAAFVEI
jgi:hypothetical protein